MSSYDYAPKKQSVLGRLSQVYEHSHFECDNCGARGEDCDEVYDKCTCGDSP